MSKDVQQLERLKMRLAKACFILNFGLGFIALPLSLVVFQVPLNYFLVGWLPTLGGCCLVAGYWIEMHSSMKESYAFWVVSMLFNLIGVFYALGFAFPRDMAANFRVLGLLILFWTGLMSAVSFYQAMLSYQINHPTTG